jgi:hypothetical protein
VLVENLELFSPKFFQVSSKLVLARFRIPNPAEPVFPGLQSFKAKAKGTKILSQSFSDFKILSDYLRNFLKKRN